MPVIEAHLIAGYDDSARRRLCTALASAARLVIPAPPEAVTVMLHEVAPAAYSRGGPRQPAPPRADPVALCARFLDAMAARDLAAAGACLHPDFTMHFPAAAPMTDLEQLIAWAAPRYRFVTKDITGWDLAFSDGSPVVWCRGTLAGEWPDGTGFSGIRFADRFEIEGDLIRRQEVWNDLSETRHQQERA